METQASLLSRAIPLHDPDRGASRTVRAMVALTAAFIVCAIAWAAVARLDVAVQARGVVVAPSRLQEVQSLEGGIVQQLLVQPGQRVRRGERIVQLDTQQYTASLGENRQRWLAALAGRARTDALLDGHAPRFDPVLRKEAPELVEKETQSWRDSQRAFEANAIAGREGAERRGGELREARGQIESLSASLKVGEESFALEEKLFREGAGARADYLAAQQKVLTQRRELSALQQSIPRLEAALAETRAQAAEAAARMRAQWGTERSEQEAKVQALAASLEGYEDKVTRRELFAPVDGIVNRVLVPTIGGVAQPGKPIVDIVPDEARLQFTARVSPADIGFLRPGQPARIRMLAYDTSTFGQMEGVVERVGADAVPDEKGEAYFEVQLTAARDQLKLHGKPLTLGPGMTADVSILTGERSVMQYLLKPVLRGVQGALQER